MENDVSLGLLLPQKRTLRIYGDMIQVQDADDKKHTGGGKKGEMKGFSDRSRLGLFKALHSVEFETVMLCTLTYPAEYPTENAVYKADLKEYRRRTEREFGKVRAIWKLEFQKRGAPHYHIMYFDPPFMDIKKLCSIWHAVIGSDDGNHLKLGVDIRLTSNKKEAKLIAFYMSKYMAKKEEDSKDGKDSRCGRVWGRWNIKEESIDQVQVSNWELAVLLRRIGGDGLGDPNYAKGSGLGFSIFGNDMGSVSFGTSVATIIDQIKRGQ